MTPDSRKNWQQEWHQDVFAFDDYHAEPDHSVGILDPVEGYPYMITETVGQFNYASGKGFAVRYRRAGDITQQTSQAIYHAQAHTRVADHERIAGTIAWCAFDYASLVNDSEAIKCPGVADVFRLPKLGAAFYLAQVEPSVRPVIEPSFYWDFGPQTPSGPGERAAIFSNCERLKLFIDGKPHATLKPDRTNFANLRFPPFFADLKLDGAAHPELRIDGYVDSKQVLSRSFSSDHTTDRFWLHADDAELANDGADSTRLAFAVVDRFGAPRAFAGGDVALDLDGPGVIVGDNPFALEANGGAGAVYIRTIPGRVGKDSHHGAPLCAGRGRSGDSREAARGLRIMRPRHSYCMAAAAMSASSAEVCRVASAESNDPCQSAPNSQFGPWSVGHDTFRVGIGEGLVAGFEVGDLRAPSGCAGRHL